MGYGVVPSGYIGWASTGATNVAEPLDSKKAVGWGVNEAPASSYANWLQGKADEWIQYLDWCAKLRSVVDESWNLQPPMDVNFYVKPSGLQPLWDISGSYIVGNNDGYIALGEALGVLGASHKAQVYRRVDYPRPNEDWRLDVTVYGSIGPNATNTFKVGLLEHVHFGSTGTSGWVNLLYRASGKGATTIGMSAYADGLSPGSGLDLSILARGPTMIVSRNGQQIYALPNQMLGSSSINQLTVQAEHPHIMLGGFYLAGPVRLAKFRR